MVIISIIFIMLLLLPLLLLIVLLLLCVVVLPRLLRETRHMHATRGLYEQLAAMQSSLQQQPHHYRDDYR